MSQAQRLLLLAGAVVVLVAGFVAFSPGGDGGGINDESTATTATAPTGTRTTAGTPAPRPALATIEIRGGKPVGGVKTITVTKGERVLIYVTSSDTTDEVHLHGYDIKRNLRAGGRVTFSFTANAEGIFEMELESTATQIAKLVVRPG
jgi:FtsP/CotA-like multicopper oxidase with cupredoxin domain